MSRLFFGLIVLGMSSQALAIAPSPVAGGFGIAAIVAGTFVAAIAGVRHIKAKNEE